jgi:hypothetical protein
MIQSSTWSHKTVFGKLDSFTIMCELSSQSSIVFVLDSELYGVYNKQNMSSVWHHGSFYGDISTSHAWNNTVSRSYFV